MKSSLAVVLIAALPASGHAQGDRLYVTTGGYWHVLDPSTGSEIEKVFVPVAIGQGMWSLAYNGNHLVSIDRTAGGMDQFLSLHPANGSAQVIGPTGENWDTHGMDVDPISGTAYAVYGASVYAVDPMTGHCTYMGDLNGLSPFNGLSCIAFLPNGLALGVEYDNGKLYSVNVPSLTATLIGTIPEVANGFGIFWDLALDSNQQLWGVYSGGTTGAKEGVYKIDTTNLTIQLVVAHGSYKGIAFGPATPEAHYCTPKTNSLGCAPTLQAEGLASPTATSGYRITSTNVRNRTFGRLLYSVNGAASTPFAGGTLCLNSPWKGTPIMSSGGSAKPVVDCSGIWTYDLNTQLMNKPGPQPGDSLNCQWLGRDPGFVPPDNYALTSALELTLLP